MGKLQEVLMLDHESELIPSQIYSTLIESVREVLVGTQIVQRIGPESIPGSSIDIDLNTKDAMVVEQTSEASEFFKSTAGAETINMKPVKYTVDIQISREMIEDSKFSLVEWQIQEAGYQFAKKMDALIMAQIKTGADANTVAHATSSGSAMTLANITATMKFLEADGYTPSHMIVNAGAAEDLRNMDTFVEADKLGSRETFERGLVGRVFGMNVIETNQAALDTTYDYCLLVDSRHALILAEKRPISIAKYNQENKDIVGIAVSARFKARYKRKEACAYVYCTV